MLKTLPHCLENKSHGESHVEYWIGQWWFQLLLLRILGNHEAKRKVGQSSEFLPAGLPGFIK